MFSILLLLQCLLVKFASITGATVSKFWKPNITHVIAITDEKGACKRTLKVLMAILNGKWVLKIDCKFNFFGSFYLSRYNDCLNGFTLPNLMFLDI